MNVQRAAEELGKALRHVPGVVRVHGEGTNGDSVVVLTVAGRDDVGPGDWYGYPVRVVRGVA